MNRYTVYCLMLTLSLISVVLTMFSDLCLNDKAFFLIGALLCICACVLLMVLPPHDTPKHNTPKY